MSAKAVTVYAWPNCQICIECAFGLSGYDDDMGLLFGAPNQPYAICCKSVKKTNKTRCKTFKGRCSEEDE